MRINVEVSEKIYNRLSEEAAEQELQIGPYCVFVLERDISPMTLEKEIVYLKKTRDELAEEIREIAARNVELHKTLEDHLVYEESPNKEEMDKALVFVRHIEEHFEDPELGFDEDAEVMCKICKSTISEIYKGVADEGITEEDLQPEDEEPGDTKEEKEPE